MKKIAVLFSAIIMVFCCGCYEVELDLPESYEITNGFGETYTVEYRERNGFPDTGVDYSISSGDKKLIEYGGGDYKNLYTTKPSEVLFLFKNGASEYYYLRSEDYCYIFGGEYDFFKKSLRLYADWSSASELEKNNAFDFAKKLRMAFKKEELRSLFESAGYDSALIIALFDLK